MQKNNLAASDFYFATGYGYGDIGRDKIEEIFKDIFNAEDALVRTSIVSGTHAIYIMLSSVLNHGDEFIYVTGAPYDLSLIHISEPTRQCCTSRMPSSA